MLELERIQPISKWDWKDHVQAHVGIRKNIANLKMGLAGTNSSTSWNQKANSKWDQKEQIQAQVGIRKNIS